MRWGPLACARLWAPSFTEQELSSRRFQPRTAEESGRLWWDENDRPQQRRSSKAIPVHTDNRGVDVAIEALGRQETFEITQSTPPGWHPVQSRRVFRQAHNSIESFAAGLGDRKIVTTLCPGGKERMRRLMELVAHHWVDLTPLLTHRFMLDDIEIAYDLFSHQRDGVLKVAIQSLTRRRCVTRPLKMLLTL